MKRLLVMGCAVSLVACAASADPRWWTHDQAITSGTETKTRPDVTFVQGELVVQRPILLATWEQSGATPDRDIFITASFDGGCTWCGPVAWATGPTDDARPQIAAGLNGGSQVVINVVFQRGNTIFVASDGSLSPFSPNLCAAFAALAEPTPIQLSGPAIPGGGPTRPRVAAVSGAGVLNFHVVWDAPGSLGRTIEHVVDIGGGGAWSARQDVMTAIGEPGGVNPDVTGDTLGALGRPAATIVYQTASGEIRLTRSVDQGTTWGPPIVVSGTGGQTVPAIDSSSIGVSADFLVWNATAWQSDAGPHQLTCDAARWTDATTRNPDFEPTATDHPVMPAPLTGVAPAIAVEPPGFGAAGPLGFFTFWTDESLMTEIVHRGGILDANSPTPRDLDTHPFTDPRVAPPNPGPSVAERFSMCDYDDGWPTMTAGVCVPRPRTGGGASDVAATDTVGFPDTTFATVFADDRSGTSQVYFKRSDVQVNSAFFGTTSAQCTAVQTAEATVEILPALECGPTNPNTFERLDRYLVYYGGQASDGATPTGPFVSRMEVPAPGLPNPAPVVIPGLNGGETYEFALIAEDEARNIAPPDFDPRTDTNTLQFDQSRTAPMPQCAPALRMACQLDGESCGGLSNGQYNPGDLVDITLSFSNIGDWDATNVTADIALGGATVVSPSGGNLSIPSVPTAGPTDVAITVRLDQTCPPPSSDLTASNITSDGTITHVNQLCLGLIPVTCTNPCVVPLCDLMSDAVTFPPTTPPRTGPWLYTGVCPGDDVLTNLLASGPASGATIDPLGGVGGTMTLYQLDCGCIDGLYLVKDTGNVRLELY